VIITDTTDEFLKTTGLALQAYVQVEGAQIRLLQSIIGCDSRQARLIFLSNNNVRSRLELFDSLIEHRFKDNIEPFWNSCRLFLQKLATVRNAIAHWHPVTQVYVSRSKTEEPKPAEPSLVDPSFARGYDPITLSDLGKFVGDCNYIRTMIGRLNEKLESGSSRSRKRPLRGKYRGQQVRPNAIALRQRPIPQAPQPHRQPSVPKLSRAQRRAKALKDARKKKH
jgi:hypothetical protein